MKTLGVFATTALAFNCSAALLVHVADDIDCWEGDDVTYYQGLDVEIFSSRWEIGPLNGSTYLVVEDEQFTNGVDFVSHPIVDVDHPTTNTLQTYTIYDFWNPVVPTNPTWVIDPLNSYTNHYPFSCMDSALTVGPFGLEPLLGPEVWLDWNADTTLRVTWSDSPPSNFNKFWHDGSINPSWVEPLAETKHGKALGHTK